ncbi:MAG: caspase family protein [Candidatus Marinimicrobia bacterium]|nr:caspase family protein [Candidatus Neomarinimicrobiota bacterium]
MKIILTYDHRKNKKTDIIKKLLILILLFFVSCETDHEAFLTSVNKNEIIDNELNGIKLVKTLNDHSDDVHSVVFSFDGKYLASCSSDRTVKIYNTNNWELIKTLSDHSKSVISVSFSPNSEYFATGSSDKTVKIYNTTNWELIKTLSDHYYKIESILFSSDEKYFVSCSVDNTVKIYNTTNWELEKTLKDHSGNIYSISFSHSNKYLASCSSDKTVKIYNTTNWQLIKTLSDHSGSIYSVSFYSKDKYLASGYDDNTVKIYDTSNWQLIKTLKDHSFVVSSVSFSPYGKYLASGSWDNTVKIYDINNWKLIETLRDHFDEVDFVSFSPGGEYLASCSDDNTVKIYTIPLIEPEIFIRNYVEDHINKWQKIGKFDKIIDYQKRIIEIDKKAEEFFNIAKKIYTKKADKRKQYIVDAILNGDIKILGNYNKDRETYKLDIPEIGYIVINIPKKYAKNFKKNEKKLRLKNPKIVQTDNGLIISSIAIYNPVNNKEFVCDINVKDCNYSFAEMNFEFKPYNYNFDKGETESQIIENKQKRGIKQADRDDIYKNIPRNFQKNKDAVAVIIGSKDYSCLDDVDYAINDARLVKKYLIESFGYKEENIIYIENATKINFETIFGIKGYHKGRLDDYVKKNISDVFIYYSGHGVPNVDTKKGYFVPVDCDPATVSLNGYPLDLFYKNISKIKYRKLTVVIDASFSGENILKDISPIYIIVDNPVLLKDNSFIYTSAKENQFSNWYPNKQHSLFTYCFLKGIKELGVDVTHQELFDYLSSKVSYIARNLYSREQNPTFDGDMSKYLMEWNSNYNGH